MTTFDVPFAFMHNTQIKTWQYLTNYLFFLATYSSCLHH